MHRLRLLALCAAVLSLNACASITRGGSEAFVVETEPPGAKVSMSSGHNCTTPCAVEMKRRSTFQVTIEKPGYETVTASVTNRVAGGGAAAMAGNVFFGGVIGLAVDGATGATQELAPNPLKVTMLRLPDTPVPTTGQPAPYTPAAPSYVSVAPLAPPSATPPPPISAPAYAAPPAPARVAASNHVWQASPSVGPEPEGSLPLPKRSYYDTATGTWRTTTYEGETRTALGGPPGSTFP